MEPLEVNNNEENKYSTQKHTQVRVVGPCKCLVQSVGFGRFGHQEVNQTDETALELNSIFRRQSNWTEHLPKDDL